MLKSKRDESIKRYLSKVAKLEHNSRHFPSRYYTIIFGEDLKISVRFSDHFNDTVLARGVDIDIVKTSISFYTIRLVQAGISYTITEDLVLPYLKSILLLYPEISNTVISLRKATNIAVKTSTKALEKQAVSEAKLNKRDEYIEMVDAIYEENKNLHAQVGNLQGALKDAQNKLNNANISVEASKRKFENTMKECKVLRDKLTKLKNVLNADW